MQKVVGSNPISRLLRGPRYGGVFCLWAATWPRHKDGHRVGTVLALRAPAERSTRKAFPMWGTGGGFRRRLDLGNHTRSTTQEVDPQ
jgi:hypothetical protein